ncbi:phosphatase PAP2 family protein [Candidatus Uhrbacteria bacterium]|nr:phosphatase PAP2 family protein [Candidatus Uhrbacteria bacterium]
MFIQELRAFDRQLTLAIHGLAGHWAILDGIGWILAVLLIWVLIGGVAYCVHRQSPEQRRRLLGEIGATLVIAWSCNQVIGVLAFRERPFVRGSTQQRITMDARLKSFPSDHAALAMALVLPILPYVRRRSLRAMLVVAAMGVAVGRVYVGVHYVTDILAGMVVAMGSWGSVRWLQTHLRRWDG